MEMHDTMSIVQMPWKVAIIHIQSAINTTFLKGITWNLVHTFIRVSSSTYIPFFFCWKFWNFGGFVEKIKKCWKQSQFPKFSQFQKSELVVFIQFFSEYAIVFRLSLFFQMRVWQRFPQTLIFDLKWQNMTSLWRHSRPTYHRCEIFFWSTCAELM